jgi:protein involved in polysaccharide export with SLBB domain
LSSAFLLQQLAPVSAQGVPSEQLQQLEQLYQQRQSSQSVGGFDAQTPVNPNIVLQPAVPPLPDSNRASRLEQIMSARAGLSLRQFGYDQLGSGRSVTVPQTGALQDDYVLGVGDELVVSLRGQENSELRALVNRAGQVILPRLNPIPATGRTLGEFRQDLDAAIHRAYVATSAFVSVSRVRQISVLVSGEVNTPGTRLVTGLSSVVDALILSGGIKKTGSLRKVRLQRGNTIRTIDLYSVLTSSGSAASMRLADGDRILVPPLGPTVAVAGLARRPGIYELPAGHTTISVRELLALAGGQEVRGGYRLSVLQILPDGRSQLAPVTELRGSLQDSEILFVQLSADQTVNQTTLSGGTGLAGGYAVSPGMRLSDMLKAPGALGPSPYTSFGIIVRKDPKTLIRSLVAFTPVAVLAGHENEALQSDDIVRVLSSTEARMLDFVIRSYLTQLAQDQEQIRNPLIHLTPGENNSVLTRMDSQRGQDVELENVATVPAYIQRRDITALLDTPAPGSDLARRRAARAQRLQQAQLAQQNNQPGQQRNLLPGGSMARQPENPNGMPNNSMLPNDGMLPNNGMPNYAPGRVLPDVSDLGDGDDTTNPNYNNRRNDHEDLALNYVQQSVREGSYALNKEVQTFGQFARQLGIDPLVLMNFLIDHRVQLDGAVYGPGSYLAGPNATLEDLVQAAGGTLNWADESGVELISTVVDRGTGQAVTGRRNLPLRKGMLASYVVHPRDQFRFSQISSDVGVGSVTVQGEVRYPGTFPILRGEHLSDLLMRAGGLTSTAYPYGTVYLRQSAAQAERQAYVREAEEIQSQLVVAMTRIGSSKIDPNTFASMQSFVSEVRNHQALGRVSFVADPKILMADPSRDPLLEAGDVIYIPPRPTTIAVLGEVLQPGNFTFRKGATLDDYVEQAGGYSAIADESHIYVVLPNGEARRAARSWLNFDVTALPPGSSIVVPRDVTPLDLRQTIIDVSQIFSQFAVSIASIAVLSKQ